MGQGILLIEDEEVLAGNIKRYLDRRGYEVVTAGTAVEGFRLFEQGDIDLVLLDLNLPDLHGLKVLEEIRRRDPRVKVVCVTGNGSVQVAVDAMKGGAYDYVTKPVVLSELKLLVDKALGQERLEGALSYYNAREASGSGLPTLLGASSAMAQVRERIRAVVEAERGLIEGSPPAVLIRGETGTGKELAARAFHFEGPRKDAPFIELNCSALPVHLLESELFGHERGAFTDAKERKMGLVEAAHGGTLFLDEIGDTEPGVQLKLLKLLEDRTVRRVGGVRDRVVDVRFISATNQPLEELVRAGRFRSDLYYRLRVVTIDLPPLRARSGDAEMLAEHFLALHARRYGRQGVRFSEGALARIRAHPWPGNVRELRNVVEQALLCSRGDRIEEAHLGITPASDILGATGPAAAPGRIEVAQSVNGTDLAAGALDDAERALIGRALAQSKGNVTQAAKILGISRDTLRYRIEKHGIA
ncbi:sigma-54-dependent transcriptional regulator [Microvirga tunisiensis]|uniref:Sigma-54-dependent Fis family transcriptional regulator n=1 Tax=Microvirga tunisiensis TaxID=2108360 RepID=A0A5N7MYH1_9HYPH|nr:sigma-54 dependent transcriptional regulator [Microvirga tunisiensis]MPR10925.1 sigma-54-dependent Fis family transcriptional regulator [Microvirga tunisiensis]MPR29076.1 sigma-54-dependent Fis family transcriptional regulator [Microvirga tunisiensis]